MPSRVLPLTATDLQDVLELWSRSQSDAQQSHDLRAELQRFLERNPRLSLVARDDARLTAVLLCGHDGHRGDLTPLIATGADRDGRLVQRMIDLCLHKLSTVGITACQIQVSEGQNAACILREQVGWQPVPVTIYRVHCSTKGARAAPSGPEPETITLRPLNEEADHLDPVPTIPIDGEILLTPHDWSDQASLLQLLNTGDWFAQQMLSIAYPYTPEHARQWVTRCILQTLEGDRARSWAIRRNGELIGGIGLGAIIPESSAEIGYWLSESYWGQGIMPRIVRVLVRFAFAEYRLQRIQARVFRTNPASVRVLQKAGFLLEGTLRRQLIHLGLPRDVHYFSLLADDLDS